MKKALATGLSFLILCSVAFSQGSSPDAGLFKVDNIQGEVMQILDGQDPKMLKSGDRITGGKLVTLEDSSTKLTFPDGKDYPVPANTLLFLDPKCNTLEGSVAAAAAIRDPSVHFVIPGENAVLPLNKPFSLIVGINLEGGNVKGVDSFSINAVSIDDPDKSIELGQIKAKPGKSPLSFSKSEVSKTPGKAGEYELIIKTIEKPIGKQIGKSRAVSFK